jgi:hypothetical protein
LIQINALCRVAKFGGMQRAKMWKSALRGDGGDGGRPVGATCAARGNRFPAIGIRASLSLGHWLHGRAKAAGAGSIFGKTTSLA